MLVSLGFRPIQPINLPLRIWSSHDTQPYSTP